MQLQDILKQPITFRKKVFKLAGNIIHAFDPQQNLVLFVKQKAFRLKEDIRVYADKAQSTEMLYIQARKVIDFKAAYDVVDSQTQEKVGALRRKGWSSMIQDQWELLDKEDNLIGRISEDSTALAIIRRFLTNLIPQTHSFTVGDSEVATLKQRFNPFILKSDLSVSSNGLVDPRLILAGAVLLMTIEGRQQ